MHSFCTPLTSSALGITEALCHCGFVLYAPLNMLDHVNDAHRVQHIMKSYHVSSDAGKTEHSLLAMTTLSCTNTQQRHH